MRWVLPCVAREIVPDGRVPRPEERPTCQRRAHKRQSPRHRNTCSTRITSSHHVTRRFFLTAFFCFQTLLPEVHLNQCTLLTCDRNEQSRPRSRYGRVQLHTHPKTKIHSAQQGQYQPLIRISLQFHHKNVRSVETETLLRIPFITDHLVKEMCFTEPICRRKQSIGDNNASVVYIPTRLRRLSGVGAGDE